jgi:hypothetical protein
VPTQRFAVEFDRRTVGIAVRVPGGFMFFSSDKRFDPLDGRIYPRARAIERALKRAATAASRSSGRPQPGLSFS